MRSFAGSIVDDYSDSELKNFYQNMEREEFFDFFTKKVDEISDDRLLAPDIHKSWWSHAKMIATLEDVGFSSVRAVGRFESNDPFLTNKIYRRDNKYFNMTRPDKSLFVEAIK